MTREEIDAVCQGWSSQLHWEFFRAILKPEIRDVLICGVYEGRDIAYMKTLRPNLGVTGIDLFSPESLPDWPPEHKGLSWEDAGYGHAPTLERAAANLAQLGLLAEVGLGKHRAEEYLETTHLQWDLIYIDTSHDYETTRRTIRAAVRRAPRLAGDDYTGCQPWGVVEAVKDAFTEHQVFGGHLWFAEARHFKEREHAGDPVRHD